MTENMSKEDMVKEAVEEAKAKAAKEQAEAEETATEDAQEAESEAKEATEEATETEGDSEAASEGKKKFFGKKEKKDKKDEKIEELTDRVTRQMAEFDNFRKRSEKEKSQMYEIGAKDIIEKILPVVDNFERGLDSVPEEAFFFLTLCFPDADVVRFFLVSEEEFVFLLLYWPLEILVGCDVDVFSSFV